MIRSNREQFLHLKLPTIAQVSRSSCLTQAPVMNRLTQALILIINRGQPYFWQNTWSRTERSSSTGSYWFKRSVISASMYLFLFLLFDFIPILFCLSFFLLFLPIISAAVCFYLSFLLPKRICFICPKIKCVSETPLYESFYYFLIY